MRTKLFRIGALALAAAIALVGCGKTDSPVATPPVATLTASSSTFVNDAVTLTVNLSAAASADVTATLEASGSIPASALSFGKSVTVKAGETKATVAVTLSSDALAAGDYAATFTLASASGATISTAAQSVSVSYKKEAPKVVEVNMDASKTFTDGIALVKVYPSDAPEKNITVKLAVSSDIPASALAYEESVVLKAGSTADVETPIAVDMDALEPGDYTVTVSISSDTENVTIGSNNTATISLSIIGAVLREDWTIRYDGREYSTEDVLYDWFVVEGWEGDYYDVLVLPEGALEYYGDVMTIIKLRHESYVAKYISNYTVDQLLYSQNGDISSKLLDPGKYEIYLIDYTADANYTGMYAMNTFEIEQEEATEEYLANLGTYTFSSPEIEAMVEIVPYINNNSYGLVFGDEFFDYETVLDWDAETNTVMLSAQFMENYTSDNYGPVNVYLWGWYTDPTYGPGPVMGTNYGVASGAVDGNTITFNALPVSLSDGSEVALEGFSFFGYILEGEYKGYYLTYTGMTMVSAPFTLTKVEEEAAAAAAPLKKAQRGVREKTRKAFSKVGELHNNFAVKAR